MPQLQSELIQVRSSFARVHDRLKYEKEQLERIERRLADIERQKTQLVKAVGLIDRTIAVISANGIGRIETTVTNGLRLVFDNQDLGLKVVKKEGKRGNAYGLEGQQGEVSGPILDTFGGGVANVISLLLRVIMIKRFKLAKCLVVDESFNNVSAAHLPMVSRLLKSLASDGGFAIFAVTHQPILASAADHVYSVAAGVSGPTLRKLTEAQVEEIRLDSNS